MNTISDWLESFGLNQTEIKIFLCIAQFPHVGTNDIQKHTGLVRTTIYHSLSQLKNRSLISEEYQNNIKQFRACDTSQFRTTIEASIAEKTTLLDKLSDVEEAITALKPQPAEHESYISRYEGDDAIKKAIEQAFRCKSKHWLILASRDNFLSHTSKQYQQYYLAERNRRGIVAKTLWEPTASDTTLPLRDIVYRNPRRLPEEFRGAFSSLVIIYDDTTLIIDAHHNKTAHAIHNTTSTQLLRLLHETIWRHAERIT